MTKAALTNHQNRIDIRIKTEISPLFKENLFPNLDGIIDIERYLKSPRKIIWVLKDTNGAPDESKKKCWDARIGLKDKFDAPANPCMHYNATTYNRMVYAMQMVLNNKNWEEDISWVKNDPSSVDILNNVGIINIKKIPGGPNINSKILQEYYDRDKSIIWDQLNSYKPDIVICGGTFNLLESDIDGFDPKMVKKSKDDLTYTFFDKINNRLFLNVFHPAHKVDSGNYATSIAQSIEKHYKSLAI